MAKIALVTGANKGIGKEIARQLGAEGVTVLIGARNSAKAHEAAQQLQRLQCNAAPITLDVTLPDTLAAAAKAIEEQFGKLDILVNNAGVLLDSGDGKISAEQLRQTYDTNVFGVARTIEAMLPLLKKAIPARIVNISSGLGSFTWTRDPANRYYQVLRPSYNSSKTAVNALTVQYAKILQPLVLP